MTNFEQSLVERKNLLLKGRPLRQNQGQGEASIRRFQLEVSGGREDKRHTVEERLITTDGLQTY